MRELAKVVIVAALLIGVSAVAIHGLSDRALFVPPPDAVAEGFIRDVVMKRFDHASDALADGGDSARSDLPALARRIELTLGTVDDVSAETITSTKEKAVVRVRIRSAGRTDSMIVKTVWTGREWRVVDFIP